ncbi:hypothetical protein PAMP_012522 [Pampus punctatissimus]
MTSFYDEKDLEEDLIRVNCPDEDLEFEYLFEYEPPCTDFAGGHQDDPSLASHKVHSPESEHPYGIRTCSPSYSEPHTEVLSGYDNQEARNYLDSTRPVGLALSPRIEITPSREHYNHVRDSLQNHHLNISPRPTLTVPGHENLAYREPQCLSPASSNSSTSWHSENYSPWASPCVSPSSGQNPGDLCPRLQNIHTGSPRTSPGTSPHTTLAEDCLGPRSPSPRAGSRSTSPQGKRTYEMYKNPRLIPGHRSRSPSPHSGHEDHNTGAHYTHSVTDAINGFGTGHQSLVPTKIVKTTNQVYTLYPENPAEGSYLSCDQDMKTKPPAEQFFVIPQMWSKPLVPSICRINFRTVINENQSTVKRLTMAPVIHLFGLLKSRLSQRSAHELPMVEKQDMDGCSVLGGQQMILTGQNFSSDSKVIFMEKTQDGQQIWEMEATVDKDKSQPSMLFVEVPSYRDTSICHSVKVNFYVINGKRKRSQPQHFTYSPLASPSIKTEPIDEYEADHMSFAMPQILGISPHSYYPNPRGVLHPDNGLVSGMASCQRLSSSLPGQDTRFQQQGTAIVYSRGGKSLSCSPGLYQQTGGMMPDPHRSVLVHTGSPAQSVGLMGTGPSIIQFSPTNHHLLRAGDHQPLSAPQLDDQQIIYCDGYSPQSAHSPTPPLAQAAVTHPQQYPTVIQQQPYVQKGQQKSRAPPGTGQMEAPGDGQRRVTVKEENLDQAYLDDDGAELKEAAAEAQTYFICSFICVFLSAFSKLTAAVELISAHPCPIFDRSLLLVPSITSSRRDLYSVLAQRPFETVCLE